MRIVRRDSAWRVPKTPRHSEVNQQSPTGLKPHNQILAAPLDRFHALALQFHRDGLRIERTHESCVENLDALEPPTREHGRETLSYRLDFRQLGHTSSVAAPSLPTRRALS